MLGLLASVSPPAASGATVFYSDRDAWQAASTGLTSLNFEGIAPPGGVADFSAFPGLVLAGVTFSSSTVDPSSPDPTSPQSVPFLKVVDPAVNPAVLDWSSGAVVLGGAQVRIGATNFVPGIVAVLPPGITAIGVDLMSTAVQGGASYSVNVRLTTGVFEIAFVTTSARPTRTFVGVTTDAAIERVILIGGAVSAGDQPLLDNFVFGQKLASAPIPPSTVTLLHRSAPSSPNTATGGLDPVNLATGSYVLEAEDLAIPTRGLPLLLRRTYHSAAAALHGPLGFGWTHSYAAKILPDGDQGAIVQMPDGRLDRYTRDPSGAFDPPAGIHDTLTRGPDGSFLLTTHRQTTYAFSAAGHLMAMTDRNGNVSHLEYSEGHLTSVVAPDGRRLTFEYDQAGRLIRIRDPLGRVITYDYGPAGTLVAATDASGATTRFDYDELGRFTKLTDPIGTTVIANTYDAENRVIQQLDADGNAVRLDYAPGETRETDALGHTSRYRFDERLRLTSVQDALGFIMQFAYDTDDNLVEYMDQRGATWRYAYDARGNLISLVDPLSTTTSFQYDPSDNLVSLTDTLGRNRRFVYDQRGNLTTATDPLGRLTVTTYDQFGQVLTSTDPAGRPVRFEYDVAGNTVAIYRGGGQRTALEYDAGSRLLASTDPQGGKHLLAYDAQDRLLRATNPMGRVTLFAYDPVGRLISTTDPRSATTQYSYTRIGTLSSVTDATRAKSIFADDVLGRRTSVTDPNGAQSRYEYDPLGRLARRIDPLGHTIAYAYDASGNPVEQLDANGYLTKYAYDAAGRLAEVTRADGSSVSYAYDTAGRRIRMSDPTGLTTYSYNEVDEIVAVQTPNGDVTMHEYDGSGNRVLLLYPDGFSVRYDYDESNQLVRVADSQNRETLYGYDLRGNVTTMRHSNGTRASLTYDAAGQVTRLVHMLRGLPAIDLAYKYDSNGNRIEQAVGGIVTERFEFDILGQLTTRRIGPIVVRWRYDAAGNRIEESVGHKRTTYSYDAASRLLRVGARTFSYDSMGNLLRDASAKGTRLYSYDTGGYLVAVDRPGADVTFRYDGDGNRVQQTDSAGTRNYVNDIVAPHPTVLQEYGAGPPKSYVRGLGPVHLTNADSHYTLHLDILGSVIAITDLGGRARALYSYSPWGEAEVATPGGVSSLNTLRFTGEAFDRESGLYYLRARYYDPEIGRFISKDPLDLRIGESKYVYVNNNPLRWTDPSGLRRQLPIVQPRALGSSSPANVRRSSARNIPTLVYERQAGPILPVSANYAPRLTSDERQTNRPIPGSVIGAPQPDWFEEKSNINELVGQVFVPAVLHGKEFYDVVGLLSPPQAAAKWWKPLVEVANRFFWAAVPEVTKAVVELLNRRPARRTQQR